MPRNANRPLPICELKQGQLYRCRLSGLPMLITRVRFYGSGPIATGLRTDPETGRIVVIEPVDNQLTLIEE